MADEEAVAARATASGTADALALGGASRGKADAYLDEQLRLARLQSQNLIEQNAFELSHLRWRRFNDQLSGALRIILVVLGVLMLAGIGVVLWNASQADGLVIESFSAPPDYASRGLGGDVIATAITNRIANIRALAASSLTSSSNVSKNGADDLKVDIPNTGVSLGEAWRFLRRWLGSERHLTGSLHELPNGQVALNAVFDNGVAIDLTGSDLDKLEQQLAERIFASFDPINMSIYLWNANRVSEALKQAERNTSLADDNLARANAYALLSDETLDVTGNAPLAVTQARLALALNPKLQVADREYGNGERAQGHDEAALAAYRSAFAQTRADQPKVLQDHGYALVRSLAAERIAAALGDFDAAENAVCGDSCVPVHLDDAAYYAARRHDASAAKRLIAEARAALQRVAWTEANADYYAAVAIGDWRGAIAAARERSAALAASGTGPRYVADLDRVQGKPMLAVALAGAGRLQGARAAIAATPRDCYDCLRARGAVEGVAKNWAAAASWFDRATRAAPSIPFAYADWGEMLLHKGDLDDAMAKFTIANQKGPHFADPLEMWGEALVAKNRSDLALAKFEEANKYAPNWGRLHLKWGEALLWSGDHAGAQKQFAVARTLELTPSEQSLLARMEGVHG